MVESGDQEYYGFTYKDCDGKVYSTKIEKDGIMWSDALHDYIRFLESIYGYEIKSKVRIEAPKWLHLMQEEGDFFDPWSENYFYYEDEKED